MSIQALVWQAIAELKASDPYSMTTDTLTHAQLEQGQILAAEKLNELIEAYHIAYNVSSGI